MPIFYGLVQMIRWLFMLGFNSVCFYNTRNRPCSKEPSSVLLFSVDAFRQFDNKRIRLIRNHIIRKHRFCCPYPDHMGRICYNTW